MTPELTKVFIAEYSVALSGLREDAIRSKTEQLQKKEKLKVAINNIVGVAASGHASAALLTKLTAENAGGILHHVAAGLSGCR